MAAAEVMLDEKHSGLLQSVQDDNNYVLGEISGHNIVIACLPAGVYGITSATASVSQMRSTFPGIRFALMVGIGGGVPNKVDIRLGDVVVSQPTKQCGGVIQYGFGKSTADGRFERIGALNKPPTILLKAISTLKAKHLVRKSQIYETIEGVLERNPKMKELYSAPDVNEDRLFNASYNHVASEETCNYCTMDQLINRKQRPEDDSLCVHYGLIASGNQVMKSGKDRDRLAEDLDILCFEMEAAGIMDQIPCLVIRGICDYADSHKNKSWQGYASLTAAAYAKELLSITPSGRSQIPEAIIGNDKSPTDIVSDADIAKTGFERSTSVNISHLAKYDMRDALDRLRLVAKEKYPHHVHEFANLTLDDTMRSLMVIQTDLARKRCLRNMKRIIPFLERLNLLSRFISDLCDGSTYLSWLWVS